MKIVAPTESGTEMMNEDDNKSNMDIIVQVFKIANLISNVNFTLEWKLWQPG